MNDLLAKHPLLRGCEPQLKTMYMILAIAIDGHVQRLGLTRRHDEWKLFINCDRQSILAPPYTPRIMTILREMVWIARKNPNSAFECVSRETSTAEEFELTVNYLPGYDVHAELRQIMEQINSDQEHREHEDRMAYIARKHTKYRLIAMVILLVATILVISVCYSQ